MPAYASGGVVYTRPLRAGSRRETAFTGGPESCNLGSGPVNSMVNIMNRPQVAALGPHVLCNLGGGYSPTANRRESLVFRRQSERAQAEFVGRFVSSEGARR